MKIGILTVPFNNNYGGFLQAYALTTVLKRMGHEVVVINRRRNRGRKAKIRAFFLFIIPDKQEKLKEKISVNTQRFVSEYIKLTKPLYSSSAMKRECARQKFDCLIVGSDQVWRYRYAKNSICDYFFGYLEKYNKTPRFSYAASFGVDFQEYPLEYSKQCADYLKKFKAISVREDTAINILKHYFDVPKDVAVVADPTLLLQPEDYRTLYNIYAPTFQGKYVFRYVLDESDEYKHTLDKIIHSINLPVFTIKAQTGDISQMGVIEPVEKWLAGIAGSSLVITDSYHGTVFSILFNRPFVVLVNPTRGITRIEYLLRHFGLLDRMLTSVENNSADKILSVDINWDVINERINNDRKKSIDFIKYGLS